MTIQAVDSMLHSYSVSSKTGFLPQELPLQELSGDYYQPWEVIIRDLPSLLQEGKLRSAVDKLPILSETRLQGVRERQRAYVILSFLAHAYIWGGQFPSDRLPPQITCPYLPVAEGLGLPPTATYAALNLWNFALVDPSLGIESPDNLRCFHTFTGTDDESWFYLISVAIEAAGASIIAQMIECNNAVRQGDDITVIRNLKSTEQSIYKLGTILERMYERCQPEVFYHSIRPFLAGSKGMAKAGLPNGVFYDRGSGQGEWRQYSGGSNAQSSLIQFLDIVLGVNHYASGNINQKDGELPQPSQTKPAKNSFIQEMRNYMPGDHRAFLMSVAETSKVRDYALKFSIDSPVRQSYSSTIDAMAKFRDKHIQIVTRYIINPSTRPIENSTSKGMNLAIASSQQKSGGDGADGPKLVGTGGTALIPFLKQTRKETKDAASIEHDD